MTLSLHFFLAQWLSCPGGWRRDSSQTSVLVLVFRHDLEFCHVIMNLFFRLSFEIPPPPPPLSGASIDLSKTLFLLLGIYGVEKFPPKNFNNYPKYGILLTEQTLNQVKWRCALPVCCQAAQIPTIPISLSVRVLGWLFPLHSLLGWLQVPTCLPEMLVNTATC